MMIKEFCVDYTGHDSNEYSHYVEYTVKIKTGSEVITKEVPALSVSDYTKALKDLGYTETFFPFPFEENMRKLKEKVQELQSNLDYYTKKLQNAENDFAVKSEKICDWWWN